MIEVEVTIDPQDLLSAEPKFVGRVQNRGPATVYRAMARTKPNPQNVRGWRHAGGSSFPLSALSLAPAYTDPVTLNAVEAERFWVWTASGSATLVLESGEYE